MEPPPFIEMVPSRAVDGIVFTRPSYFGEKFGYYKAICCMFDVLAVGPPTKVIRPLEVLIGAFKKRYVRSEKIPRLLIRDVLDIELLIVLVECVHIVLKRGRIK